MTIKSKPPAPSTIILDRLIRLSEGQCRTTVDLSLAQKRAELRAANTLLSKFADGKMSDEEVIQQTLDYIDYMFSVNPKMFVGTFSPLSKTYHINLYKTTIKRQREEKSRKVADIKDFSSMRDKILRKERDHESE